jgi:PAS domain S-box-containing protein
MKLMPSLERYSLAALVCFLGFAIAWLSGAHSSALIVTVVVCGLYAGQGPGLFAFALSAVAFPTLSRLPPSSLSASPTHDAQFGVFVVAALLVHRLIAAKQRSDEARRLSDEYCRIIADTAADAMLVIDETEKIVFANRAATQIFGCGPDALVGCPLAALIDRAPSNQPPLGAQDPQEVVAHRRDGTEFPAEISFAEILREGRRSFAGFVRDLSELKQSQAILRKNESYLAEAQKLSHTGSFGLNLTTGEIYWTEENYRITGFPLGSKVTMERILDLVHPDDRQEILRIYEDAAIHGGDLDYEHRFLLPDGTIKNIHVVAHSSRNQHNQIEYIGAVTDISDTRRTEEELRRSEEKYRDLINLSPDAIYVLDEVGVVMLTNPAGARLLACPPEEAVGIDIAVTHLPEDRPAFYDRQRRASSGESFHFERTFVRPDGTTLPVEVSVTPIHNGCKQSVVRDISARKRAQEALQRSEFYLSKAEKLSHTGSWAMNLAAQRFVYWSPENYRIQHHDPSWPIPTFIEESRKYTPEDWIRIREAIEQTIQHKTNFDLEAPRALPDGTTQYIRIVGNPRLNEAGEVVEIIGTTIDITEQARARAALSDAFDAVQRSEDQLRLITDSIPVQVWSSAPDGSLDYVNLVWTDYTGLTIDQVRGWAWIPLIHEEDIQHLLHSWSLAIASGEPREVQARVRRADGIYRWFLFRGVPLRNPAGDIVQWYGTNTDIEDRKHAEEALVESERSLRLIIDTIPALVWSALPDGTLESVNQRIVDYLGVSISDLAVRGWIDFLHPDDVEATLRTWTHSVATGTLHEVEYRMRCADGTYRWFHVRGQPLRNDEGRIVRWYGLLSDIEDRKNALEALRRTQERLSRATQIATIGEFAASIAHEVNQPLAAVIGNAHACHRWLLAQPPNLLEANLAAEHIIRDSNGAAEVIRRVRSLFKQVDPEVAPLDLNDVLTEVVRLLTPEILRHGVLFETDLEKTLPPILADRLQLQQVLFNLLQNGIEAMESLENKPRRLSVCARRNRKDAVHIEVRDHGHGLVDLDKPFEAFYTTKERGMGMGLAICRSIIVAHSGSLWAAPTEGPGATFCLTLPVSAGALHRPSPELRRAPNRNAQYPVQ